MFGVLALLLASIASTQAIPCIFCEPFNDKNYCCYDSSDSHYCCSAEEYFLKGGFLDTQTMAILIGVGVLVLVIIVVCICCCCCSCCPFYKRRRQGAVYNSVVPPGPPAYHPGTAPYYPAQYPQQHPSNPYLVPNATAPAFIPAANHQ